MVMDSCLEPLITNNNEYKGVTRRNKLSFKFKVAYGVGHVLNDVCSAIWFTYLILFMQNVITFDSKQAGLIVLIGQVADAVANPFVGYVSDKRDSHWLCAYGKRKIWHLIGTICVILTFPFIFLPCIGCGGSHTESILFYYSIFTIIFQFGWAAIQISHLSLIPEITPNEDERTELAAMRYRFTVVANLFVYILAWAIIGANGEVEGNHLTPDDSPKFGKIVQYSLTFGVFCTFIFHYFVKEKSEKVDGEIVTEIATEKGSGIAEMFSNVEYYKVAVVYMSTMVFVNLTQIYIPVYLHETLQMARSSLALIPLILYLGSFVASTVVEKLNKVLGRKKTYAIGAVIGLIASIWIQLRSGQPNFVQWEIVAVAIIIGVASAIILVTNLGITADLIGNKTTNSAFIYSIMTVTDKLANGIIVYVLQHLYQIYEDRQFYQYILVYVCGGAVILATCSVIFIKKGSQERQQEEYVALP